MSNLNQFIGIPQGVTPTALVGNDETVTPVAVGLNTDLIRAMANIKQVLSGALTATTWKTVVSVTGGGVLQFAAVQAIDATARAMAIRITLNGTVVTTRTTLNAAMNAGSFLPAVGGAVSTSGLNDFKFEEIPFSSSLLIEIQSSLTETDKIAALVKYRTY